jgi:hypothetical protein
MIKQVIAEMPQLIGIKKKQPNTKLKTQNKQQQLITKELTNYNFKTENHFDTKKQQPFLIVRM